MSPVILFVGLTLFTYVVLKLYKYYQPYWILPGPPLWSFLKLVIRQEKTMNEAVFNMFRNCEAKYRDIGLNVYFVAGIPMVFVHDPASVEMILKDPSTYIKSGHYKLLKAWLGRSVVTTNGADWKERKRLLVPGFHASVLKNSVPVIQSRAKALTDKLRKMDSFDALTVFSHFAFGSLCETMMGYKLTQDKLDTEYCRSVREATRLYVERLFNPLNFYDFIYDRRASGKAWKAHTELMRSFCGKIIAERKATLQTKFDVNSNKVEQTKYKPLLDTMLTAQMENDSITDEMIIDEVNGLVFAGHDSTALTLAMGMYVLSKHPHALQKIKDELRSILGSNKERDWTFEDLSKMVYLEASIKEGLRMYTMSEVVRANRMDVTIKGFKIPKGSGIVVNIMGPQKDPKLFPEPNSFKPERFLDESGQPIVKPNGFMPFHLSPRQCLGQHYGMQTIKLTLAEVARHFSPKEVNEDPKLGFCIANKPMSPLIIELIPDPI